jgi:hypothetical protein
LYGTWQGVLPRCHWGGGVLVCACYSCLQAAAAGCGLAAAVLHDGLGLVVSRNTRAWVFPWGLVNAAARLWHAITLKCAAAAGPNRLLDRGALGNVAQW